MQSGLTQVLTLALFREMRRGMRKFLPEYKKVVFRAYMDKDFQHPVGRGELQEHLGIMGPFIRTEINDLLTVSVSVPFWQGNRLFPVELFALS